jgi:hypothetical protein
MAQVLQLEMVEMGFHLLFLEAQLLMQAAVGAVLI